MTSASPPSRQRDLYDALLATQPQIERKGAANRYTAVNGNMFTFLSADGRLGIRLAETDRAAFMDKYRTRLYENHGAILKEYVAVPDRLLARTDELSTYLAKSYEYAKTLKPKATSRQPQRNRKRSPRA